MTIALAIALTILSIGIVMISAYGVLLPEKLLVLINLATSGKLGLWSAVFVRLLLASLLWLTADASRTPNLFIILAVVMALSAIAHLIAGRVQLRKLRELLGSWPLWAVQLPCLLGVVMGGFMIWAVSPAFGPA